MSIIQAILASITSGGGGPAYINVYGWSNPMDEGQTNTAYVDYINYPSITLYWAIDNFASASNADWEGGVAPSGSFSVGGTGSTTFSWTTTADMATEGGEGYVLTVGTTPGGTDIINQYLTINDTSTTPKADFTIEWWQKVEYNGQNTRPWSIGLYPTQTISLSYEGHNADYYWINNSIVGNVSQTHAGLGWQHMAYVRNNGVVKGYLNGVEYFSANNNSAITDTTTPLYVGTGELAAGMYQGFIKDLHIIKGVAKYTGNFTPPILPVLTQAQSVFLLSAASDGTKYVDSVGSKSGSVTGTVTWSNDTPFTVLGPYSQYSNQYGTLFGGQKVLTFAFGSYNADLLNVKTRWDVSVNGQSVGTVSADAYDNNGSTVITIPVNFDPSLYNPATWTFTQPDLGGSLYFNSSSYINYGGSADWAMDV